MWEAMHPPMPNIVGLHRLTVADEKRLADFLFKAPDENAYLLGLISDYSVGELMRMQWGWFHWFRPHDRIEGVLYLDTTGLAVVSPSTEDAIRAFAGFVGAEEANLTRIICEDLTARRLD